MSMAFGGIAFFILAAFACSWCYVAGYAEGFRRSYEGRE